jgi:hypothetical protein
MELDIGARLSEHDEQLRQIFEALRQLIAPPPSTKRPHRLQGSPGRRVVGLSASTARRFKYRPAKAMFESRNRATDFDIELGTPSL